MGRKVGGALQAQNALGPVIEDARVGFAGDFDRAGNIRKGPLGADRTDQAAEEAGHVAGRVGVEGGRITGHVGDRDIGGRGADHAAENKEV